MISIKRLRKKEDQFQTFIGMTVSEFDQLLKVVEPIYAEHRARRLKKDAHAGGRPTALIVEQKLIVVLMYMRLYVSQTLLGFLFDIDETTVGRDIKRMTPVLLEALPIPTRNQLFEARSKEEQGAQRIQNLNELLKKHPEFDELRLDATEQPVPQPENKQDRKDRYSGKQSDHTVKTQVLTTDSHVLHITGGVPGRLHDAMVTKGSGILHMIPLGRRVEVDRGYEGIETLVPELEILKPIKKARGAIVTLFGKIFNRMVSRMRMPVEHIFAKLKKFNILAFRYRGSWDAHENIFVGRIALWNIQQKLCEH